MWLVPLLVLLVSGCFAPVASTPDAGAESDAGSPVDAGPFVDPSCEGLVPELPTTCDDRNGGCDPRATCRVVSGEVECTCGEGFVGDGVECHPPGWSWVDAEPPYVLAAAFDPCLDRVLVRAVGATALWSFNPRAEVGRQFRRLGWDLAESHQHQIPVEWGGNAMTLSGRTLFTAGLLTRTSTGTSIPTAFSFDVDLGRGWSRQDFPPLGSICADGPGRLLGVAAGTLYSIDSSTLDWSEITLPEALPTSTHCVSGPAGSRARLLVPRVDTATLDVGIPEGVGWRFEAHAGLPSSWVNQSLQVSGGAIVATDGRIVASLLTHLSATQRSAEGLWTLDPADPRSPWIPVHVTDDPDERTTSLAVDTLRDELLVGIARIPFRTPRIPARMSHRVGVLRPGQYVVEPLGDTRTQGRWTSTGEAAAVLGGRGDAVIEWGGESALDVGRGVTAGLRTFTLATRRWEVPEESGDVPFPRLNTAVAMRSGGDRFLFFGGHNPNGPAPTNDVYELTLRTNATWRKLPTTGDAPPPLSGSIVTVHDDFLWVIGGQQLHPTQGEDALTPETRAWRLSLTSNPAAWERVDDGTLPHVRFWARRWSHRAPTRGFTIPGLGLVAAGPPRAGDRADQHYVFSLTAPVTASPLTLPEGLPPVGIEETSASLFHDSRRARLIVAGLEETWAIPLAVDGSMGTPVKLCTPSRGTSGWGFSLPEGLLTAPNPIDGYVRMLDASTPACVD